MEEHMFCELPADNPSEPSFLYLMLAAGYFRRASRSRHPHMRGALRDLGRECLTNAHGAARAQPFAVIAQKQIKSDFAALERS
jgi:hypothetical protein